MGRRKRPDTDKRKKLVSRLFITFGIILFFILGFFSAHPLFVFINYIKAFIVL